MSKKVKTFESFEWIDLRRPSHNELLALAEPFNLEVNLLEDSIEHGHLPKIENVGNFTFLILRAYSADVNENYSTVTEFSNKIAFFINENVLITIHQTDFSFLETKTKNYESSEALMLAIINDMLLTYDEPVQLQSEKMDNFEQMVFLNRGKAFSIESLYFQKSMARISKKVLLLTQSVLNQLEVQPAYYSTLQDVKETTVHYLLQYDEVIEDAQTILNSYLSITAQRSNDVMKLLTIFSAFFLPLTFIVGVYGMNFQNMPELRSPYGYFVVLGVMVLISLLILIWFRRKKIL